MSKYVAYYRVSTQKQGQSGLGLEAQRTSVSSFLERGEHELVAEFTEVETGKGANALDRRLQLKLALECCRKAGATLLIAKLDRLARNVHFITGLIETGCDFVAVDMPQANKVMLQIHAVMSEYERDQISARTKAALKIAKANGTKLGVAGKSNLAMRLTERKIAADEFAQRIASVLNGYVNQGFSQRNMVHLLNQTGIKTPQGKEWSLIQLQRTLKRMKALTSI